LHKKHCTGRERVNSKKILVIGGGGHFGQLLVEDLRRNADCEIVIAGHHSQLEPALAGASVAICVAGPFQTLPTTVAELCLRDGIHYIDFADDRRFVRKVRALAADHSGPLPVVCTAWSTVSALSGVLARIASEGMDKIDALHIHMAPGNRVPRGGATIASLLYSVGSPFTVRTGGHWRTVRGWSEPRDFTFPPPIGVRPGYLVDVPDHESFPILFEAATVEFRTASELKILNTTVSFLAWLVERGVVAGWASWAGLAQHAAALVGFAGHDWGGVGVEAIGPNKRRRATVVANSGGQRIAVMPAAVMTELLVSGSSHRGLISPVDWLTREQLDEACTRRSFRLIVEDL
jgi:hypothetical protein